MFSKRAAVMLAVCAALAACSETPSRDITAPEPGTVSLDVAGTKMTLTDLLALVDVNAVGTEAVSALQAATGGRATGQVQVLLPGQDEKYSFNALSVSSPPPFAAKGEVVFHIVTPSATGVGKGSVDCLAIVGNTARIAALWESFRIDNTDMPIPPGQHLIWTVQDNGEGAKDPPDQASIMFQGTAAQGAFHCAVGFVHTLQASTEGNVQVRP